MAIADGAGSAAHADIASRSVVEYLVTAALARSADFALWDQDRVLSLFRDLRRHLADSVTIAADCDLANLASTAMLAIAWRDGGVFAQVGDGAWVLQTEDGLSAATWPVTGEYANQTKFITSDDTAGHLVFHVTRKRLLAVAGFTDGIQSLALNYTGRNVHQPFFERLFAPVHKATDTGSMDADMAAFLDSPQVNNRTDDDKSLVLACWHDLPGTEK